MILNIHSMGEGNGRRKRVWDGYMTAYLNISQCRQEWLGEGGNI